MKEIFYIIGSIFWLVQGLFAFWLCFKFDDILYAGLIVGLILVIISVLNFIRKGLPMFLSIILMLYSVGLFVFCMILISVGAPRYSYVVWLLICFPCINLILSLITILRSFINYATKCHPLIRHNFNPPVNPKNPMTLKRFIDMIQ